MSTPLDRTLAEMTPEERTGAQKLLVALVPLLSPAPAKAKRPRAPARPRVELPDGVTPDELERHRAELADRGVR